MLKGSRSAHAIRIAVIQDDCFTCQMVYKRCVNIFLSITQIRPPFFETEESKIDRNLYKK